MASKLNSFKTRCFRIMLGIKRLDRVPNQRVYEITSSSCYPAPIEIPWSYTADGQRGASQRLRALRPISREKTTKRPKDVVCEINSEMYWSQGCFNGTRHHTSCSRQRWLENTCSRLLRSRTMMMMMRIYPCGSLRENAARLIYFFSDHP